MKKVCQSTAVRILGESLDRDVPTREPARELTNAAAKVARTFYKYTVAGPCFRPVGNVKLVDNIPPGTYRIASDMQGVYLEQVASQTDDLMVMENSPMQKVCEEVAKFWERKQQYADLGLMMTRGFILYGPPGSGKSIALQQVGEAMARKGDIMLFANSPGQISSALDSIRQIEPDRRIVVAFEEADELASYDERTLLRLMDGDMKVNNVVYLATTNYIERLSPRLQRPGRFDKRVYVGPPTFEHRLTYLRTKLSKMVEDTKIMDMAKKTEGLSYGHLRELIAGAFAIGDNVDEVILRLRDSRNIREGKKTHVAENRQAVKAVSRILG